MDKPNTYKIDKNKVRKNFSNAANYDNFTSYHNLTLKMMSQTIKNYFNDNNKIDASVFPKNILDIGCGTGQGYFILNESILNYNFNYFGLDFAFGMLNSARQKLLIPKNPNNALLICADAELLPLKYKKFDIIFSNMMLHWLDNIEYFLNSIESVLKDEGIVILSFLTFGTLKELSACIEDVLNKKWETGQNGSAGFKTEGLKLHKFYNLEYMGEKINKSGLKIVSSEVLEYAETADSSVKLLKRINMLGAKNAFNAGQISPGLLKQILNSYDKCYRNVNDKVYATYKIAYLVLKKIG